MTSRGLTSRQLHDVYQAWKEDTESRGNVQFKFECEVLRVVSRTAKGVGPVQIEFKASGTHSEGGPQIAAFDELILAVDADSALKLLGKEATWREQKILGNVKYLHDVTITHNDLDYMNKVRFPYPFIALLNSPIQYYEIRYNPKFNAPLPNEGDAQQRQEMEKAFEFASRSFRPLYYTMQYPQDLSKIEMSFDLTHYQPQFRGERPAGPSLSDDRTGYQDGRSSLPASAQKARDETAKKLGEAVRTGRDDKGVPEPPLEKHVFQTIFLDRDGSQDLWTLGEISQEKRIYEKWWKQQSHRWQHYATVVPFMMFINGKQNTQYVLDLIQPAHVLIHLSYAGAWSGMCAFRP